MKLVPSVAYLRIQKQFYVGYSMALAGWVGEHLIIRKSIPKPSFMERALKKLGFSLAGEDIDDDNYTYFFKRKDIGISAYFEPSNDLLFLQVYPFKKRIGSGVSVRAQYIEFYDQFVVSIEPAQKLPPGIKSIGVNPLILEDYYPISTPYWGMVHEDWESDLKMLVMRDEVFNDLERNEYRCPICFSELMIEDGYLKCHTCGFVYAGESEFDRVLSRFSLALGEEEIIF
ncbi:hypothetical protein EP1X_08700 [Thermococcus sp. EP1]|uniref:hypothetical protein n=1 Tax=Thermococcus sp. EP1 TaxID=1591054 RepID=UPI0006DA8662|nr:hypothetical protein [Thermococcus sp. EP1]KPU62419.1 hypothetical protein EP1X_08700 [Thermococcus sp. EP1]